MPNNQQVDIKNSLQKLLALPAKKQLEAIVDSADPGSLVRAMHAQDILLVIREVGAEDALELFELLNPSQVQELLDLEIWDNDDLNPQKAGHYFSLLFEANPDRAVEQLDGLDIELLGLMYKMVAEIYDTTLGEEPVEFSEIASESPDGRFMICFADAPEAIGLSRALYSYLDSLYARDMKKALHLLENVRFELASGLEERSLKWRNNRLLDMGVLPRDERLEYFSTLSLGALKRKQPQSAPIENKEQEASLLPMQTFAKNIDHRFAFLREALSQSSPHEQQAYFEALTHASLNMHASWSGDFGDREEMIQSVEYVKTLCEYGLMQASNGELDQAASALHAYGIKAMIRLGRTALVNLRKTLLIHDNSFLFGQEFSRADTPLREMARALTLPEPRFFEGLLNADKLVVRFFNSLLELNATLKAVHELKFRAQFVGPLVLGFSEASLDKYPALAHANIFARYLLNSYLDNKDLLAPIGSSQLKQIFMPQGGLNPQFVQRAKEIKARLAEKLVSQCHYDASKAEELCDSFLNTILIQLEQNHELLLG